MEIPLIANLENLLSTVLNNGLKCESVKIQRLTTAGENYGSLMLAIVITARNVDTKEESHVKMVAKLVPPNDFMKQFMNVPFSFRNELGFYNTIAPCLRQFQKEQGSPKSLDFFPHYYGGRLTLDPENRKIDDDFVILLGNLKEEGYAILDRRVGFHLEAARLVLTKLAELHGTALALKVVRPDLFEENLMPFFEEFSVFDAGEEVLTSPGFLESGISMVKEDELCELHLGKIRRNFENAAAKMRLRKNSPEFRKGVFTTFVHGDLWVNNIMVKAHMNKIVDVKFIDMQLFEYYSITRDVLFFIFTSIQSAVLKEHLDDLFRYYHGHLIANLEELKCDTTPFSFGAFMREMKTTAQELEYLRLMLVLHPIFATEDRTWVIEEITKERLFHQIARISEQGISRARLITREFIQRGWI